VASVTGLLLAVTAAGLVVRGMFRIPFVPSLGSLTLVWLGVTLLTVVVGMVGSHRILTHPPLPTLRQATE
jgi:predicted lysophospholipase L1 biosynthesis ABC-type transport system permease subunit